MTKEQRDARKQEYARKYPAGCLRGAKCRIFMREGDPWIELAINGEEKTVNRNYLDHEDLPQLKGIIIALTCRYNAQIEELNEANVPKIMEAKAI